jgi:hypothetical protein
MMGDAAMSRGECLRAFVRNLHGAQKGRATRSPQDLELAILIA